MLEGLDKVDWKSVHHSHGTAQDFPKWLEELCSPNKKVRNQAYSLILEYSNHQGSHYPITPVIVPFLIQLLQKDEVQIKSHLLRFLYSLSSGEEPDPRFVYPIHPDYQESEFLKKWRDTWAETNGESMQVSFEKTHLAAAKGLEVYLNLLETNPYLKVRITAAQILRCFPELAGKFIPRLIPLILKEKNATLKANMVLILAEVPATNIQYFDLLESLLNRNESRRVRVVAAYAQAKLVKENTSPKAFNILLSIVRQPEKDLFKKRYLYLSTTEIAKALCNLDKSKFGLIAAAIWEGIKKVDHYDAFSLLDPLYYLTFEHLLPFETSIQIELTGFQRLILDFVASESDFWWQQTPEKETRTLLYHYNLPDRREDLQKLLDES